MIDSAVEDNIVAPTEKKEESPVEPTHDPKVASMGKDDKLSRRRHLFGRQNTIHESLGSGKSADILLWRNKQLSTAILTGATVIWLLFEWIGYHLLPFLCHFLILTLAILFLWSNLSSFVNRSPPTFPDVRLSQELCNFLALLLRDQINQACLFLREVASGKDIKKFLTVIFTLWIVSAIGGWFEFLTVLYMMFVVMLTAPLLYERNEDLVDAYGEKAGNEIMVVLQKLPLPFLKNTKQH